MADLNDNLWNLYYNVDHRVVGAEGLENPRLEHTSSARQAMAASQGKQAVVFHHNEIPRYLSGKEVEMCDFSLSPTRIEKPSTLVTHIQKPLSTRNSMATSYTVIYFSNDDGVVNYCDIDNYTVLSESASGDFGYQNTIKPTTNILLGGHGTYIEAGTEFTCSPSIINGIYSAGVNAKTIYTGFDELVNDSFIISKDLADRMESTGFMTFKIKLDENSFPLNLFGTPDDFRCLPEPGEEIEGGVLFAFRNANETSCVSDLNQDALRQINYLHDNIYPIPEGASIIDIKIYIDPTKVKFLRKRDSKRFAQLIQIYDLYNNYYKKIIKEYKILSNQGYEMSNDFNALVTHAMGMTTFSRLSSKKAQISFVEFEITVAYPRKVNSGNKITCRMASKGVVASGGIWPTENMPITESGIRADLIVADNSPFNRLNIAQWYEQFVNYSAEIIRKRILSGMFSDVDMAYNYVLEFKEMVAKKEKDLMDVHITPYPERRKEYIESLNEYPIYNTVPPFSKETNPDMFKKVMERFNINKEKWSYIHPISGERIFPKSQTIIGDKYIYLLGKLPDKEVHAVQFGYLSQFGLPMKEGSETKQQNSISNTPIRGGVDEFAIMSTAVSAVDLSRFVSINGNSLVAVKELQRRLSTDKSPSQLYRIDMTTRSMVDSSTNISIFKHMMACCGREIKSTRLKDPAAKLNMKPGRVSKTAKPTDLKPLSDDPYITSISLNGTPISFEDIVDFVAVERIMKLKADNGKIVVLFSDGSKCIMPARVGIVHLILWDVYFSFNVIPTKKDVFKIKHVKKSFISNIFTQIYYRMFKVDYHMYILERLWIVINYLNKFNVRYCAEYNSTLCGIDLAEIVQQEVVQDILKKIPDETIQTKAAEAMLKFLTDELIDKLKSGEIKSSLKPFIETDSLNTKQIGQALIAYGPRDDIDNTMPRYIVKESCFGGLKSVEDIAIESLSVKKSQQYNKSSMTTAGAFQKEFRGIAESQGQLFNGTCGNEEPSKIFLKGVWRDNFIDRVIIDNGERVILTYKNIGNYLNKEIELVSPVMCNHEFGHCEHCAGYGEEGILKYFIPHGMNIGVLAACIVGQSTLQKILSSKHLIEMDSVIYNLPYSATSYMEKSHGGISWKKSIKPELKNFSLRLPLSHNTFGEFDDLSYTIKNIDAWSAIRRMQLVNSNGDVVSDFYLSDNIVIPYFSQHFLRYMSSVFNRIKFTKDDVTIPLDEYNPASVPLKYKLINQDMNAFVKTVSSYFITNIRNYKGGDALAHAYNFIYTKSNVPSYFVDVVVKAFRVDMIQKDGYKEPQFLSGPKVLERRDVPSKLRHQHIPAYISNIETYLTKKSPSFIDIFFGF